MSFLLVFDRGGIEPGLVVGTLRDKVEEREM